MTASSIFTSADVRGSRRAVGDSFLEEGPPGCVQGTRKEEGRDLDKGASNADMCSGFYKRGPSVLGSGETEEEREVRDEGESEDLRCP